MPSRGCRNNIDKFIYVSVSHEKKDTPAAPPVRTRMNRPSRKRKRRPPKPLAADAPAAPTTPEFIPVPAAQADEAGQPPATEPIAAAQPVPDALPVQDVREAYCRESPSERMKKLREAVDRGGIQAHANFIAYLVILIYFFVAVTGTTHEDLLRETPKSVPCSIYNCPFGGSSWSVPGPWCSCI